MAALPESFHPLIRSWFIETYANPTAVQAEAWPLIERGEHVLALAPTGSGKTLTAFLSAISRFCLSDDSRYPDDKLTVLYVSPLKALNEDIRRNLLEPLEAIRARFERADAPFPGIRVETRSGDTPQSQRRRFLAHPPAILALTPESLAILLLSVKGRQALSTVRYVILDEIHAVLGNKRGSFLSCQIDRLALLAGEFQRVSLSATVRPPEIAAAFVGGIAPDGKSRTVRVVAPQTEKHIELAIEYPAIADDSAPVQKYGKRYAGIINYILNRVQEHSTILVFTDSRRRAERLCYCINQEAALLEMGAPLAFPHHGSLAKELRQSVERRLAKGELPCVVATASLELGIDIGSVDEVVLAGSPALVSQALQRIGRSGHGVGQASQGKLFPFHGMDLLWAFAVKSALDDRDIESVHPIENPLDILAQIILALCVERDWNIEELYTLLRRFYIFRNLNNESYIRTVRMLAGLTAGRGAQGRLRELKSRIWLDHASGEMGAREGSLLLLYASGGVIASRGQYALRLCDGVKIGEVDEEFVWERRLGDKFHFGGRGWRITGIGAEAVEVAPLESSADFIPFWRADTFFRSPRITERVLAILDRRNTGGFIEPPLAAFLNLQCQAQGAVPLACSSGITAEIIESHESGGDLYTVVLHTFRGGAINYPFALALTRELEDALQLRVESFSNDDAMLFLIPRAGVSVESIIRGAIMALNAPSGSGLSRGERLFRSRLEVSGVFGAHFREAAERSLLLPRAGFGKRTPLWITRQRSKRLFDAVCAQDGFPVTAEAWRTCLVDVFDMEGFRDIIASIADASVTLSFFYRDTPSPFSQDLVRQETNALMYEYDERSDRDGSGSSLSDQAIAQALGDAAARPALSEELTAHFTARLRREIPGWAPEDERSLSEWVKERIAIPLDEWETLISCCPPEIADETVPYRTDRLSVIKRDGASFAVVVHREWKSAWNDDPLTLLGLWLRYEGPVSLRRIQEVFGESVHRIEAALSDLGALTGVVRDVTVAARDSLICDRENLDMLLRLSRRKARAAIPEYPAAALIPFIALRQGLALPVEDGFFPPLAACRAPVRLWETELFPARGGYRGEVIDGALREGRLVWYGAGKEKVGICAPEDLDLVYTNKQSVRLQSPWSEAFTQAIQSGFFDRPRDFWDIKDYLSGTGHPGIKSADCVNALWHEVWQGRLSSDSFEPVRRGIMRGFQPPESSAANTAAAPVGGLRRTQIPRALRNRWKDGAPVRGGWFSLVDWSLPQDAAADALDEAMRDCDRVRLLLARWGILCRPLLEREMSPFTWSQLLPAMRRMELAGELVAGRFFTGINSLQFAGASIARELEAAESFDGLYWMNAADPASPAGLDIEGLDPRLPARLPSNRLYFHAQRLIAVSVKNGKNIWLYIPADDGDIPALITLIKLPRTRMTAPEQKIVIESINDAPAALGVYAPAFIDSGFITDRGRLII